MLKKLWALALAFALIAGCAAAEQEIPAATITEVRTAIGENAVAYPQLTGMADAEVEKKINDDIVLSSNVASHLITLATLGDSPWGLQVTYEAYVGAGVFSTVISAKGKMPNGRDGHVYAAMTYDLATGDRLALDSLFKDVDAAVSHMEAIAEESLMAELNGYMEYSEITPLPKEHFTVDEDGVTFWYPSNQLLLLSGYSGACQFYFSEVAEYLPDGADELPARLGWLPQPLTDAEARALIAADAEAGRLPHVAVTLGDSMTEIVARNRLTRTPDEFPGGRYFVLEAPAFRGVLVISDAIQSGVDGSVAEGLQLKRGTLHGLTIGEAERARWRQVLGEPQRTIAFSENMAYDYNLPVGESDVYRFGENELRLHADASGVLCAVQLSKAMTD